MSAPTVLETARTAHAAGFSIVPPREDGTKRPEGSWKQYQTAHPDAATLKRWYIDGDRRGVGVIMGAVSGGAELLEFEGRAVESGIWSDYCALVTAEGYGELLDRVAGGYCEDTPSGGVHLIYRIDGGQVPGNEKLAKDTAGEVLIETRGEGGYVITAPTNGGVHPNGGAWVLVSGGFDKVATITPAERDRLHTLARRLDQTPKRVPAPAPASRISVTDDPGPWDTFPLTAGDVLERAGFTYHSHSPDTRLGGTATHYTRPGKNRADGSSVTVWADGRATVFSSSVDVPAEVDDRRRLTPWQLHTHLNYGGDFAAAARDACRDEVISPEEVPPPSDPPDRPRRGVTPADLATIRTEGLDPIAPDLWHRRDGHALLYRGKLNVIFGAPEAGKTWAAICAAVPLVTDAARMGKGVVVVYFDFEDDARSYLVRMQQAGADLDHVITHSRYYSLNGPISDVHDTFDGSDTAELIVVDTVGSAMSYSGLDPLDNKDALRLIDELRRLRNVTRGAAWLNLDHEPITTGTGRRQAIGAQSKLGAVDGAQYRARAIEQPRPGERGVIGLYVTKDRAGGIRAQAAKPDEHGIQHAATLILEPRQASTSGGFTFQLHEPDSAARDNKLRGAILDAARDERVTPTQLRDLVTGSASRIAETVKELANEGHLIATPRRGGGIYYQTAPRVVPTPGTGDPFPPPERVPEETP